MLDINRISFWAVLIAAFALTAQASPSFMYDVLKERVGVPQGWVRRSISNESEIIPLRIALKQANPGTIESTLNQTSDPDSKNYLKHLSKTDVLQLLKPSNRSAKVVRDWLESHDAHLSRRSSAHSLLVEVPVHKARRMLNADFSVFEHRDTSEKVVRTTEYHLPRDVADHVDFIGGTTYFSTLHTMRRPARTVEKDVQMPNTDQHGRISKVNLNQSGAVQNGVPSSCNASKVTNQCLRDFYGTADYKPKAASKTHIGIAGFLNETANYQDLDLFLQSQRPDALRGHASFDYISVNGATNNQSLEASTGEAALDVQTAVGITWPIRTSFYSVGGSPPFKKDEFTPTDTNEPYLQLLEHLLQLEDHQLPDVLSVSYGDDEQTVPEKYARRVCTLFAALGLRGVTVFDSSGDQGVGGDSKSECVTNDGNNKPTFLASFPSTCPYVTSVGATQDFAPERVTTKKFSDIVSGGGFSRYFNRPSYQDDVVTSYLTDYQGTQYHDLYNPLGRAYPDVAAQGSRFLISVGGKFELISGTSASTPLFASIVSLLNDARIAQNKATLGFINPLLYKRLGGSGAFNDITHGSAEGCGDYKGFKAAQGWDPVTGFGTPKFKTLLNKVLDL
ncbi:tripeptidyl-peptidase I [Malassezia psittaci]|uniref:tripeptidyl-peptidase II n=1 Tax=Malassezia psittaci TaxID=1821823 RepID=A0AAF0F9X1_9BASI|nr:tripeptidyl-peptidase I [Malassezia psittaci]